MAEDDFVTQEPEKLIHEGVLRPRKVDLPWDGLRIADQRLVAKRDANGNIDPYWQRPGGSEVNLTGEVLLARATSSLTLTTSDQSITGDGDSSKVRVILPTIGEWLMTAFCDFNRGVTTPDVMQGSLYVDDSGSAETGVAAKRGADNNDLAVVGQQWKVTTTAANTPVELKAKMTGAGGNGTLCTEHTSLTATIGAGGGSTVETVEHGNLSGLGDTADHAWATLVDGSRAFTGEQSMGTNKLTNVVDPTSNQDAATKNYVDDNYQAVSEKSVANGYVSLDGSALVPRGELPDERYAIHIDFGSQPLVGQQFTP